MIDKSINCQCGLILKTGDELYAHLSSTGHQLRNTSYNLEHSVLIDQQLMKWRMELYSAVQMLQGEHLKEFKKLIAEIATVCDLQLSDTGTFTKPDE